MSSPADAIAVPRAPWLSAQGSLFLLGVSPLWTRAVATPAVRFFGISGGDDPSHLCRNALLHEASATSDNYWYGGSYGTLTYGIVYYWLAQYVPGALLTVLAGGLLPLLFHLYLRDAWRVRARAPVWTLATVMVVYLAWGQAPFLLAMCLTMGGLVLLARGHPLLGALPCTLGVFANPLAIVAGGIFLLAALVAHPAARRGILVFALAMTPVCAVRIALAAVFAAPSWEYHYMAELGGLAIVALVGIGLARRCSSPERRALQWVFVALLVVVVPAYLLPDSLMGSNAGRFFYVFGGPLIVAVAWPSRLRWPLPAAAVVAVLAFQLAFPVWMLANAQSFTATRAAFFATAVDYAARVYDPDYRFHVVTPQMHWESYYFPAAGFPITRGWYRQDDALHNEELYDRSLDIGAYSSWLRRMGVRYVFVPHAPLEANARRELAILDGSSEFTVVYHGADWTVYRLRRSQPLVVR